MKMRFSSALCWPDRYPFILSISERLTPKLDRITFNSIYRLYIESYVSGLLPFTGIIQSCSLENSVM